MQSAKTVSTRDFSLRDSTQQNTNASVLLAASSNVSPSSTYDDNSLTGTYSTDDAAAPKSDVGDSLPSNMTAMNHDDVTDDHQMDQMSDDMAGMTMDDPYGNPDSFDELIQQYLLALAGEKPSTGPYDGRSLPEPDLSKNSGRLVTGEGHPYWQGTAGADRIAYNGAIQAGSGNDTLISAAAEGPGQIHLFGQRGADWLTLSIKGPIDTPSSGHHVFGELKGESNRSPNVYSFINTRFVETGGTLTGRLDDFDPTWDKLMVGLKQIDLTNLPSNMRIVAYNGNFDDPKSEPIPWLLINTASGGHVFYSLVGFRIDMDGTGGSANGEQAIHFIDLKNLPDFSKMPTIQYENPFNFVPKGFLPSNGGKLINDSDVFISDVLAPIKGTIGNDMIAAGLNSDIVHASDGSDNVWGGYGDDTIFGGTGFDILHGGRGSDRLHGEVGDDTLWGDLGHDTLRGGLGGDLLIGGTGNDFLLGEGGDDKLHGGFGNDKLDGGDHSDTLMGEIGNDTLYGMAGNDYLDGSWEKDMLFGQFGNDTLVGGFGNDYMSGGLGSDVFVFANNHGIDTISDFDNAGNDVLDLRGVSSLNSFAQVMAAVTVSNGDIIISTGGLYKIILKDLTLAELDRGDFIF